MTQLPAWLLSSSPQCFSLFYFQRRTSRRFKGEQLRAEQTWDQRLLSGDIFHHRCDQKLKKRNFKQADVQFLSVYTYGVVLRIHSRQFSSSSPSLASLRNWFRVKTENDMIITILNTKTLLLFCPDFRNKTSQFIIC